MYKEYCSDKKLYSQPAETRSGLKYREKQVIIDTETEGDTIHEIQDKLFCWHIIKSRKSRLTSNLNNSEGNLRVFCGHERTSGKSMVYFMKQGGTFEFLSIRVTFLVQR